MTYLVVVHSRGKSRLDVHEHEYEIAADSKNEAIESAKKKWRQGIQPMWPDLSVEAAYVIDDEADPNLWEPSETEAA